MSQHHQHHPPTHRHQHGSSLGSLGSSPPLHYRAQEPLPPSVQPSFGPRHMPPPPASPQKYSQMPSFPPLTRGLPPAASPPQNTFPSGRDLPALSSIRPGSSMSISSMLGTDMQRHARDSAPPPQSHYPSQAPPTTASSPPHHPLRPASPYRPISHDPQVYKRPRTPERYQRPAVPSGREQRANSTGSGSQQPFWNSSVNQFHQGPLQPSLPEASHNQQHQHSRPPDRLHQPFNGQNSNPQRPTSQPASHNPQAQIEGPSPYSPQAYRPSTSYRESSRYTPGEQPYNTPPNESQRAYPAEGRPLTQIIPDTSQSQSYQPSPHFSRYNGDRSIMNEGSRQDRSGGPASYPQDPRSAKNSIFRDSLPESQTRQQSLFDERASTVSSIPPRRPRSPPRPFESDVPKSNANPDGNRRGPNGNPGPYTLNTSFSSESEQQRQRDNNDSQASLTPKGHLSVGLDLNKLGGRKSPLPQAVQGAQGQINGPGGEPGIKSEFGRMFSGIGSGVGRAMATASPVGNGSRTPTLDDTPTKSVEAASSIPARVIGDGTAAKSARPASRSTKKSKKAKDEEPKIASETSDGRSTPAVNGRSAKRNKHGHHHHHHQHGRGHHHHHHHHKADDESSPAPTRIPTLSTVENSAQSPSSPQSSAAHHHHHHHHHHHRVSKPATPIPVEPPEPIPVIPSPRVKTTIISQPLLDSVAHLPRSNLGSIIYSSRVHPVSPFSHTHTITHAKLGYASSPRPLPRFEGKENCIFTVRVPTYHLEEKRRGEICARRACWGTDVYTDDSDVVAAAVHGGWLKGAWGNDIDVEMLDLNDSGIAISSVPAPSPALNGINGTPKTVVDTSASTLSSGSKIMTAPPDTGPPAPIPSHDLQLTLLVLPALQSYASTVSRGLRSRSWGDNHDGMSFRIVKAEWVHAQVELDKERKEKERGGEARRKRLMKSTALRKRVGDAVKLNLRTGIDGPAGREGAVGRSIEVS